MKATKWQRAVSLLLCLLMAMSFLTITAPKAYAAGPSWPQITKISVTDGYVYDTLANPTVKAAITDYTITQYDTRETLIDGYYIVGEVCLTVSEPVKCSDGAKAEMPAQFIVKAGNWSIDSIAGADMNEVQASDTTIETITAAKQENGEYSEAYNSSSYHTVFVSDDNWDVYSYYRFKIVVASGSSDTVPTIKTNVENPANVETTVGTEWTLNLSDIFEDKDGKDLTYKVKVNDGGVVAIEGSTYRYTPSAAETTKLTFTANNGGAADSEAYIVNLTAKAGTVAAPWPQITKISVTDGYVYDTLANPTVKAAITDYTITQYDTRETLIDGYYIVGEVCLTVSEPVKCSDGAKAEMPAQFIVKAGNWSIDSIAGADMNEVQASDTTIETITAAKQENGEYSEAYNSSSYHTVFVSDDNWDVYSYYRFKIVVASGSSDTVPTIKTNVENPANVETTVGTEWTLNLSDIFEDKDGKDLTYKVKVNDGGVVAIEGSTYRYTPSAAETTKLTFTANNGGAADSEAYIVNLTAKIGVLYNITASADGKYQWATVSGDMGYVEITVNDVSANQAREGDTVVVKAISKIFNFRNTDFYDAKLDHWVVDGVANLTDSELKNPELTFTMPANAVSLKAVFVKTGSQVTLTANFNETASELGLSLGQAIEIARTCDDENRQHLHDSVEDTFISGAEVSAFLLSVENPNTNIKLVRWEITNTTTDEPVTVRYETWGSPLGGNYDRPYFTVDGTSNYTIKAIFAAKDYGDVNVTVNDESMGTATAQIGTEEAAASIKAVVEGTKVKLQAQPKTGYVFQSWSATYGSDNTPVNIANSTAAQTTFVMPPTNRQPVKVVAEFALDPSYLSEDCALTDVTLLDNNDSSISYNGDMDGTDFTIEVPADTDNAKLANMILKLTYSENAQVFRDGSDTPWNANGQACNMTLGTRTKFVVRSQKDLAEGYEGPKRAYTITINCAKSTKCAIESAKLGEVEGTVDQTKKTVTFTVPADTDESAVADMPLTFNCSQDASIKLKDAKENWDNGTACGMALNEEKTFVVTAEDGTTIAKYTVVIHRTPSDKKALTDATLGDIAAVINEDSHAATFTVPADTTDSKLGEMILKFTCSPRATVKLKDADNNWPDSGEACRLKLGVPATFVVTAEDTSTLEYTVTVNREKSTEKAITEAVLTKTDGTSVKADISEQNKTITFTLPVGTTDADVAAMTLKFTCSQYASIKLEGAETNWPADGQLCGMKLNEAKTFVVTAENGGTQKYPVLIVRGKSAAKEITSAILLAKAGDTTSPATVKIDNAKKTIDFTLPAGSDTSKLGEMILKLTVSDYATVKKSGDTGNWPAEGKACGMELNKAATFTVTAENGDKQDYTVTITRAKSSENEITAAVLLNQTGDTTPFAKAQISGTNIIFTLPSDTNKTDLNSIGLKYLKLTYPESATAKMVDATGKDAYGDADGTAKWRNGDVKCNMSLNTPVKFIITAEDNTPKTYTVEIKYTAPNAPTLSDGSAARSSKTAATVKFTTNEAGTYYYKVVTHGAAAPTADEIVKSTTKGTASAGETTFTLSNLTTDARDVYIVVVSAAGGESAPLKVEIPAYDSGSDTPSTGAYKISVSTPKGGTITTNRTKADAGDEIIVTVTPDNGYQMVSGSLTYTLAKEGGETKTITNGRFTMPASDVSITCKWETAATTAKGITSFSISGVVGAVNNTTNTITITLPRGTDVTKLTPVIATNGVKSLTPGSGETVDFTNAVTYTAAMEDGSSKTYTVTVYVDKGTLADQFWDKLTDFATQVPWWQYAEKQQSTSKYPKYW